MDEENHPEVRRSKWKDLLSFWIFGLCNNYGYVVMLTAAEDIINSKVVSLTKFKILSQFSQINFFVGKWHKPEIRQ